MEYWIEEDVERRRLLFPYLCQEDINSDCDIYVSRYRDGISSKRIRFFRNFPYEEIDWDSRENLQAISNAILERFEEDEDLQDLYFLLVVDSVEFHDGKWKIDLTF